MDAVNDRSYLSQRPARPELLRTPWAPGRGAAIRVNPSRYDYSVSHPISVGAIAILRHMCKYGLKINGDPTKDIPWFYVPTDVARKAKRTGVEAVDTPAAKYCLELIDRWDYLPLNMPAFRWTHFGKNIHAAR